MTEDTLASLWVMLLVAFVAGEALGMVVCAICAGWFDKIMNEKTKKKKAADAGTSAAARKTGRKV